MTRDYAKETEARVAFIRARVEEARAGGVIYGNSGGKDSALVGILCKRACPQTIGVILPCQSSVNYGADRDCALEVAARYGIQTATVDLTAAKEALTGALSAGWEVSGMAAANINPRLRMTALYALGQSRNLLVAGTGNRSEAYLGYFTKWGDGAHDFNPIGDLTVREVYEFLAYLDAPLSVRTRAPSAGLFEGQTDEKELGLSYADLDAYLLEGAGTPEFIARVQAIHARTQHKRSPIAVYPGAEEGTEK